MHVKSNLFSIALVVLVGGFVLAQWGSKAHAASVVTQTGPGSPDASARQAGQSPAAAPPFTGASAVDAGPYDMCEDNQSDERAGKGVDVMGMGVSPKGMSSAYLGPKEAAVVVNAFMDFECPVCKRSADPIKQLVADFPGKVKIYFRNNALAIHGRSKPAALAAWAAKQQGKFWQYHDRLFETGQLGDASLENHARVLGLDMEKWRKDMANPKAAERIAEEAKWAEKLGARGTPGIFVNGIRQVGWSNYRGLKAMVAREIENAERLKGAPVGTILAQRIKATAAANTNTKSEAAAVNGDEWAEILTSD
jgi:protein-disulfide isomerase